MGIGTLGFLKGSSGTMLNSIEARDAAETELKKQKQLAQFRNDLEQQNEMAKATTFQIEKDAKTGKMRTVGYNSQGQRLDNTARDSTQAEVANQKQGEEDRGWTLEERGMKRTDFTSDENERAQRMRLANSAEARANESLGLERQYKKAAIANMGKPAGSGLDGSGKVTMQDRIQEALYRNQALINSVTTSSKQGVDAPLTRADVEVGVESLIREMAARGVPPSEIDTRIRQRLIPSLIDRKANK